MPTPTAAEWLWDAVTLRPLWATPNTVWCALSIAFYLWFPYDLSPRGLAARAPLSAAYFAMRFPLFLAATLGYTGFWHVTLYWAGWGSRPFVAGREYRLSKVAHNLLWSICGVAIWTCFDNVFAFLWATGRLPYLSDEAALSSWSGGLRFLAGLILVPLWRDAHFYFAHRLLHTKAMYTQVHSLHHRNTDIDPFAGLCMHPVEHLYYYACIVPSLFFFFSPFAFLWNGMHLLLSPGASHSGYEDHFQSDAYHYAHHRYFECNYAGSNAGVLDVWFGSFLPAFKAGDADGDKPARAREDAKSTILGLPSAEFVAYLGGSAACLAVWAMAANAAAGGRAPLPAPVVAAALAAIAGFGPQVLASLFAALRGTQGGAEAKPLTDAFLLLVGSAVCSLPVAWAAYLALRPPAVAALDAAWF